MKYFRGAVCQLVGFPVLTAFIILIIAIGSGGITSICNGLFGTGRIDQPAFIAGGLGRWEVFCLLNVSPSERYYESRGNIEIRSSWYEVKYFLPHSRRTRLGSGWSFGEAELLYVWRSPRRPAATERLNAA